MYKNTFSLLHGFLNEVENSITCLILTVEYNLVILIKPKECEISNTDRLPVVWNLFTSTVYNMCNLVCNYELDVLGSQFITNKKAIFDFNGANHVLVEVVLLLLLLLLSSWLLLLSMPRVLLRCLTLRLLLRLFHILFKL